MTGFLPIYLRKETREGCRGVAYYCDPEMTDYRCFNPWESRPDRRFKTVMFNCNRWRTVWMPDLVDYKLSDDGFTITCQHCFREYPAVGHFAFNPKTERCADDCPQYETSWGLT